MTTRPFRLLVILGLLAASVAAADVNLDLMNLRDKGKRECWITSETFDETKWKNTPEAAGAESTTRHALIVSVQYAFQRQDSGSYFQAMAERERGSYPASADLFHQLAQGERECEKVVGGFEEGVSWEMAGKFTDAATAFQSVVDGFPKHPLNLDAQFRLGMVLAQAKDPKAEEVAKQLDVLAKGLTGLAASARAAAIRSAAAIVAGDAKKFRDQFFRATFNAETDRDSWLYFNLFAADGWRRLGQPKEAVPIYERMLKNLEGDPGNSARVRLGLGLCKAEHDRQGAIVDLLGLDVMPYGSPEEKCEARYNAGKLMLAEAQAAEKDPAVAKDPNRVRFMEDEFTSARLLLEAAAGATGDQPSKAAAAELLKTLPAVEKPKAEAKPDPKADAKADAGK